MGAGTAQVIIGIWKGASGTFGMGFAMGAETA